MARYIVPDTCALCASFYNEAFAANADPLLEAISLRTVEAIAPSLGKAEFLNATRKKLALSSASPAIGLVDIENIILEFLALPIYWIDIDPLTEQAWRLHRDYGLETGDAFFVEVARQWDAELWTIDDQFFQRAMIVYPRVFDLRVTQFQ